MENSQSGEDPLSTSEDGDPLKRLVSHNHNRLHGAPHAVTAMRDFASANRILDDVRNRLRGSFSRRGSSEAYSLRPREIETVTGTSDDHQVICEPRVTQTMDEFTAWAEAMNALRQPGDDRIMLALGPDGSVRGVTERRDLTVLPRVRVLKHNHHSLEDAPHTPSSQMQLYRDIMGGRFIYPEDVHRRHLIVQKVDDCDADVSLYGWQVEHWRELLTMPELRGRMEPFLRLQDELDVNAGFVPIDFQATEGPDRERAELMRRNIWVFRPYNLLRNDLPEMDGAGMLGIIDSIKRRLDMLAAGEGESAEPDLRAEIIDEGDGWIMIDEANSGLNIRQEFSKKYRVIISVRRLKNGADHFVYSIGQVAESYLPRSKQPKLANLPALGAHMNILEGIASDSGDQWGGRGDTVLGSPKGRKCRREPSKLRDEFLKFFA